MLSPKCSSLCNIDHFSLQTRLAEELKLQHRGSTGNKKSQQCGNNSLRKEIPLNFFFFFFFLAGERRENIPSCSPFHWQLLPRVIPVGSEVHPNHGAALGASFSTIFSIGSTTWPHCSAVLSEPPRTKHITRPYYLQHVLFKHSLVVATETRAKTKTRPGSIHTLIALLLSYLPAILQSEKA